MTYIDNVELTDLQVNLITSVEALMINGESILEASEDVLRLVAGCMRRAVDFETAPNKSQMVAAYLQVLTCADFCKAQVSIMNAQEAITEKFND